MRDQNCVCRFLIQIIDKIFFYLQKSLIQFIIVMKQTF